MSINQLIDDGSVIGYKPTLQYKKENNLNTNAEDNQLSSATNYSGKTEYSNTLNNFANNTPSIALNNIDYATNNMKLLIDKLTASFKDGNWNQYGEISSLISAIQSNNEEYISNFINYHKNSITGSIVPELIGTIYNTQQRLETLSNLLKELYYGNSKITTEESKEIDKSYLQKIQSHEINKDIAKINYLALSYDSVLNRSVNMYAFSANEQAINIADVVITSDDSSTDSSKSSFITKLFNEINEEINYREKSYIEQQSVEIMQKTLYNYYNKRQEIINLYDLFNENKNSIFIGNRAQTYKKQVDDAITNINKMFAGNQCHMSEIAKLEREKHFLMNIYANFNYNSEI